MHTDIAGDIMVTAKDEGFLSCLETEQVRPLRASSLPDNTPPPPPQLSYGMLTLYSGLSSCRAEFSPRG